MSLQFSREKMTLVGTLDPTSFVAWIQRHAKKLGLASEFSHVSADSIELLLSGAPDMLDAMEMGCSLGPIDVWVETIERTEISG